MKKGGYIIIDLQSASIVNDLRKALDSNKPVLVYDANNDANFYTLAYDSDNSVYTLTGAENSIQVASDGTITTDSKHLYAHFIDFEELIDDESRAGYIHLSAPIISNKSTSLTLKEVLDYLKGYEGDYYQLGLTGTNDFSGLEYLEGYTINENNVQLGLSINGSVTKYTFTSIDVTDYIEQII